MKPSSLAGGFKEKRHLQLLSRNKQQLVPMDGVAGERRSSRSVAVGGGVEHDRAAPALDSGDRATPGRGTAKE